jgi:LytS/YehU family sensor histidine kinase
MSEAAFRKSQNVSAQIKQLSDELHHHCCYVKINGVQFSDRLFSFT